MIWSYKNFSIVCCECEDFGALYEKLGKLDVAKRWNVGPWFAESPRLDGREEAGPCEKVFDLSHQLAGGLRQY